MIDIATLADHLVALDMLPANFTADWPALLLAQRRCETSTGIPVSPHDAFQLALAGHIRRLVVNRNGQVIEASSLQRLFRGAARKVVMVQHPRCTHRGCRIRAGRCQADHLHPRSRGGPTTLDNAGIACPRHNRDRYTQAYTARRDHHGWHTYRPDGSELGNEPPNFT